MRNLLSWIKAHPYSLWVTYYIPYLICFILLEQFSDPKFIIYSPIDDMIPFCEYFIIFYLMWFPLMFLSLLYFLLKDKDAFIDLCFLMFTGMSISLLIYVIAPNGLDLRVEIASDNLFAWMVRMIQTVDDPTNVCPSIHVLGAVAATVGGMVSNLIPVGAGLGGLSVVLVFLLLLAVAGAFWYIGYLGRAADAVRDSV